MKKCGLKLYYRTQICRLRRRINSIREEYAKMSLMSSRNFEFDDIVYDRTIKERSRIFKIKRKITKLK